MLKELIAQAQADEAVYIGRVRELFEAEGKKLFVAHVYLYDGAVRVFEWRLPEFGGVAETQFVHEYIYAMIYNLLSSLGALKIKIYVDLQDAAMKTLAASLNAVFQVDTAKAERSGYGKCLNVNERTIAALCPGERFAFELCELQELPRTANPEVDADRATDHGHIFKTLPGLAQERLILGMDIGGTDIKLVVAYRNELILFKEYDWFPSSYTTAEELIDPVLMLTDLMLTASALFLAGRQTEIQWQALSKTATLDEIQQGLAAMHAAPAVTDDTRKFDAIGLCFPDVVIRERIVGGETFKTRGMRNNTALDYEQEFAKIGRLTDLLAVYVADGHSVRCVNDGPMAAFTSAVEMAAAGEDVSDGFFAHTLGTELGTGWVKSDASIPEIPLEVYNFIIDLGSYQQRVFEADDLRSTNNFNTNLPGTLQKFACQYGVFRLGAKLLPDLDSDIYAELFAKQIFVELDGKIFVPTEPVDMRKPALEYFMALADSGHATAQEIFRLVGESLGACWLETQYVLQPEATARSLFGRLVKNPVCFNLMLEGARRLVPSIQMYAADGDLAATKLMQDLAAHREYTVAQFAQAVGAVYYACI